MRFEMRWLVTPNWDEGPEKILQYRYEREITDYSLQNPTTGSFITRKELTEWIDVPTVDEAWNADI
jgi:hypothetical protein